MREIGSVSLATDSFWFTDNTRHEAVCVCMHIPYLCNGRPGHRPTINSLRKLVRFLIFQAIVIYVWPANCAVEKKYIVRVNFHTNQQQQNNVD